jgi:hypothetical protein
MVETLAKSHPHAPIICISLFPWGIGEYWMNSPAHEKATEFRHALEEICRTSKQKNVYFVAGPELLSMTGLSEDMLHPSDHGMIEIATKLVPRIKDVLNSKR